MTWSFLKSDSPDSSLRVNMFLVTVPVSMILFSVFFFIIFRTVSPTEVSVVGHESIKYTYQTLDWLGMGAFVGAIIGALFSLWYGKKINKTAENETPKPGDPAQPNPNPQNLPQ